MPLSSTPLVVSRLVLVGVKDTIPEPRVVRVGVTVTVLVYRAGPELLEIGDIASVQVIVVVGTLAEKGTEMELGTLRSTSLQSLVIREFNLLPSTPTDVWKVAADWVEDHGDYFLAHKLREGRLVFVRRTRTKIETSWSSTVLASKITTVGVQVPTLSLCVLTMMDMATVLVLRVVTVSVLTGRAKGSVTVTARTLEVVLLTARVEGTVRAEIDILLGLMKPFRPEQTRSVYDNDRDTIVSKRLSTQSEQRSSILTRSRRVTDDAMGHDMKVSELVVRCLFFCCGLLGFVFALFLSPMMFLAWFCDGEVL